MPDGNNGDWVADTVDYYFNDCRYIHIFGVTFYLDWDNSSCPTGGYVGGCTPDDGAQLNYLAYTGTYCGDSGSGNIAWCPFLSDSYNGQSQLFIPPYNTFVQGYYLVLGGDSGSYGADGNRWVTNYYANLQLYTY